MSKLLLVEDDQKIRDIYKRFLVQKKFNVLEAGNGEEAGLVLIEEKGIDLVLLDIRMPVVSGTALFDLIKLHSPDAKVIIMSVYPLEDQKRLVDGADDYFDKSEGIHVLLSRIKGVLSESEDVESTVRNQKGGTS